MLLILHSERTRDTCAHAYAPFLTLIFSYIGILLEFIIGGLKFGTAASAPRVSVFLLYYLFSSFFWKYLAVGRKILKKI